jgi:hypothetical protein
VPCQSGKAKGPGWGPCVIALREARPLRRWP